MFHVEHRSLPTRNDPLSHWGWSTPRIVRDPG